MSWRYLKMAIPQRRWLWLVIAPLVVAVTSLAAILGYSSSRFVMERKTVESILSAGGKVVYFDNSYGRVHPERTLTAWLREFTGLRWPYEAHLQGKAVTNEILREEILPLGTLTVVTLTGVAVTNDGLEQLRPLKSLAWLTCI